MSEISKLEPQKVWEIFDLICSIPHISKHEAALAEKLMELAGNAGLQVIQDETGNVIIKRPAAKGFENAEPVILQAHLDMVPASTGDFDFINCAITPRITGEWVMATNTTLGSDDGIGVAQAMAIVLDKDFQCGPLTVILTVDEEAGMSGAANLAPEHLQGRYLLNLDGSDNGFCIGCAGGARQEITFTPEYEPTVTGQAVKITVDGLPGGHSGLCIHENRGNALKIMAEFLEQNDIRIASFNGGTADNAIAYFAEAVGISGKTVAGLQAAADAYTLLTRAELPAAKNLVIRVEAISDAPQKVWQKTFAADLLSAMMLVPNEVIDFDDELDIVKTSSNLATIRTYDDKIVIRTSQRSLVDSDREKISETIAAHFRLFNGKSEMGDVYPATPPEMDSQLLQTAVKCAGNLQKNATPYAIHAGLESGWFSRKNPALEIISCGPEHHDYHTPEEKLNIASVARFDTFLRQLIRMLAE
ncbi:MAG: aminoacyl-histidine dipeptidase [Lentisphaerae bacterium]|nr:aminoacyl-histidine dipeptidase [Lentisphaerota bacterium]